VVVDLINLVKISMKKYKVLVEGFILDAIAHAAGEVLELTEEAAAQGVAEGALELVVE